MNQVTRFFTNSPRSGGKIWSLYYLDETPRRQAERVAGEEPTDFGVDAQVGKQIGEALFHSADKLNTCFVFLSIAKAARLGDFEIFRLQV